MNEYERRTAEAAIDRALFEGGATLEGLRDALTRRFAAQRMTDHAAALDRAYNTYWCRDCGGPTEPAAQHRCPMAVR